MTQLLDGTANGVDDTVTTFAFDSDPSVVHVVRLQKVSGRMLNTEMSRGQIETIISGVNTQTRTARGFRIETAANLTGDSFYTYEKQPGSKLRYHYYVDLKVSYTPKGGKKTPAIIEADFQNVYVSIQRAGGFPKWTVATVDGLPWTGKSEELTDEEAATEIGYVPLDVPTGSDWTDCFTDMYGVDDQIMRMKRAIEAGQQSGWKNRFNTVLVGPPGCGKTNICQLLKKALGPSAVLEFDGTSTTMAGAQKELNERDELPRIMVIEEIEKAPEASLQWMLAIGDMRAEIRKTTAKGNIMKDVKMLVIATVNDYPAFKRAASGALASRFSNPIFFNRPSRELRARILKREVERVNGDLAWIEPALTFAEEMGTNDPRQLIAIALCGREMLLDGSYQKAVRATSEPPEDM